MISGRAGEAGRVTAPAVAGAMPLGRWLRLRREAAGLARREMARRLIQAGRAAGDMSMPGIDAVYQNIRRWEHGEWIPTERYKLYYCEVFGITAAEFGCQRRRLRQISFRDDDAPPAGRQVLREPRTYVSKADDRGVHDS